jgi:hypothetical protein
VFPSPTLVVFSGWLFQFLDQVPPDQLPNIRFKDALVVESCFGRDVLERQLTAHTAKMTDAKLAHCSTISFQLSFAPVMILAIRIDDPLTMPVDRL